MYHQQTARRGLMAVTAAPRILMALSCAHLELALNLQQGTAQHTQP